ncbi:hypothetical protein AURDEDRAFT_166053 [Auricularia subglabra TFB-10046 SS5]|nr:hypothetical protein AURDEDRAFT_166053 [Auricularia subglabra TFB-10046 SS5]
MANFTLEVHTMANEDALPFGSYSQVVTDSLFATVCCCFAALTWVTYDHLITLHDEMEYVWKRPTRLGSVLYYAVRYVGMLGISSMIGIYLWPTLSEYVQVNAVSNQSREIIPVLYAVPPNGILNHVTTAFLFALFFVVEVILQMRISALYSSRWLARVNAVIFVLEMVVMNVLWVQYKPGHCSTEREDLLTPQECASAPLYWIPGIAFEIWLSGLALAKLRPRLLREDILSVMVHDRQVCVKYFCLITSMTMAHIAMVRVLNLSTLHLMPLQTVHGLGASWTPFVIASLSIGGSRIVLHLRKAYFRLPRGGTSASRLNVSFAVQPAGRSALSRSMMDESFYVEEESRDDRTLTALVCEPA